MKKIQAVIAIALSVIALNMTFTNFIKGSGTPEASVREEKVLPVIGRVTSTFDGFGVEIGFLVKDGQDLKVLRYDKGSIADNPAYQPKYLNVTKRSDGSILMDSLQVESFN